MYDPKAATVAQVRLPASTCAHPVVQATSRWQGHLCDVVVKFSLFLFTHSRSCERCALAAHILDASSCVCALCQGALDAIMEGIPDDGAALAADEQQAEAGMQPAAGPAFADEDGEEAGGTTNPSGLVETERDRLIRLVCIAVIGCLKLPFRSLLSAAAQAYHVPLPPSICTISSSYCCTYLKCGWRQLDSSTVSGESMRQRTDDGAGFCRAAGCSDAF